MANYTIQRGDTLSQIAKDNGTTVSNLMAANPQISNPNVIRAGGSLNIPGQSSATSGGYSSSNRNTGYSSGYSGSGYSGGSGYSSSSSSGSSGGGQTTGYKSVTNYAHDKDGNLVPIQGYEKVGTSYNPTTGYLEHASGYKGQAYQGANGRYYTPEGSLIREDGYLYPEGAKISPNGMYYDVGNGWQLAHYATQGIPGVWSHLTKSDMYGAAPGTFVGSFGGGSSAEGSSYSSGSGTGGASTDTGSSAATPGASPTLEELQAELDALKNAAAYNRLDYNYNNIYNRDWEDYIQGDRKY